MRTKAREERGERPCASPRASRCNGNFPCHKREICKGEEGEEGSPPSPYMHMGGGGEGEEGEEGSPSHLFFSFLKKNNFHNFNF